MSLSNPTMHIAVYLADQNPHRDRSLGITSMTRSLLQELSLREEIDLTTIASRSSFGNTQNFGKSIRLPFRTDNSLGRLVADSLHPLISRPKVDMWYYPKGYLPLWMRPSAPTVGTMHDAIIQHYIDHYPESRSALQYKYWLRVMQRSLQRLDVVMTISEHAKKQLVDFCNRYQIAVPSIHVTYESSSWEKYRHQPWKKRGYVVHLASASPHKKTNRFFEMWGQLRREHHSLPKLTIVGNLDHRGQELLRDLGPIKLLPPLTEEKLADVVAGARALVLPSEIEGFGLPALEAYYVGTPVCYVAGTSVEEVVTEAGRFGAFELSDPDSLARALTAALEQSEHDISKLSDALFERFSNRSYADRVIEVFNELMRDTSHLKPART